jgi:hypothetical protein
MQLSNVLRTILKLDAASCLGMAALVLPVVGSLQEPLGLQSFMLVAAAISLVPIGLFILWLGIRREAPAILVWLVIFGNFGWATASLAAAAGLPGITQLGQAAVAGQGLAVLMLALAEWVALRGSMGVAQKQA